MKIFTTTVLFLFIGMVFWAKGMYSLDPDFGFHLRMGEIILQHGLPQTDPFSYTMSSFPDIDEHWLLDIGLSRMYAFSGMSGLALIFSLIVVASLKIASDLFPTTRSGTHHIALLLSVTVLTDYAGVRPQVVTWLFLAILLRTLFDAEWYVRGRWWLPLLFILWANLHGGFIAGLVTMVSVCGLQVVRKIAISLGQRLGIRTYTGTMQNGSQLFGGTLLVGDLVIIVLCVLATMINPYGYRLYEDVGVVATSSTARWAIQEWLPTILYINLPLGAFIAFSLFYIFHYRTLFPWPMIGLFCIYFLLAMSGLRHVPLWIFLAYPMLKGALGKFWLDIQKILYGRKRFIYAEHIVLSCALLFFVIQSTFTLWSSGGSDWSGAYPVHAAQYLKAFPSSGRLFTDYGWGGYTIWQLPEKKTFIDGRMALWTSPQAPAPESKNIFPEYLDIINRKRPIIDAIDRYGIDTVLWHTERPDQKKGISDALTKWWQRLIGKQEKEPLYPTVSEQLQQQHWHLVYEDQVSVIWRKMPENISH